MKNIAFFSLLLILTSCISGSSPRTANKESTQVNNPTNSTQSTAEESFDNNIVISANPVVNVYLETSGSMNGYVDQGKSQFQQVVFDYLSNIQNSGLFSEINLNYITDKITPKGNRVSTFINTLTSQGIMNSSGSKATTDIAALISKILENANDNQISIFISDCIFSPGSVTNPQAYLENQKISIRNAIKAYIDRNEHVGCTVYRFISDFKGAYFDYKNKAKKISMPRPFYIWVFGSPLHLANIKANIPDSKFMGASVDNTWTIMSGNLSLYNGINEYGLLQPSPTNGNYKWQSKTEVASIKKSGDHFEFTFGVDLSLQVLLYGEEYATNIKNYYHLINKEIGEQLLGEFRQNNIKAAKYTHDITVKSEKPFSKGDLNIVFDGTIPQWVYEYSDSDDSVLTESNQLHTYGFNYMCEGIYAGFHANNTNNVTASYNFVIK